MLPFMMMAVLALLAFLCISHIIPSLTRRVSQPRPNPPSNNPPADAAAK
jgi:predicted MFS family arabinose efflux permease